MRFINRFFLLFILLCPFLGCTQVWQEKPIDRMLLAQGKSDVRPANNNQGKHLQHEIKNLLILAEEQLSRMQLKSPIGNNAYETYQQVLKIDPNNDEAKQGIVRIGDQYQELAEKYANRGFLQRSLYFIEIGLEVVPDHSGLLAQKVVVEERSRQTPSRGNGDDAYSEIFETMLSDRSKGGSRSDRSGGGSRSDRSKGGSRLALEQAESEETEQLRQFPWPPPRASATQIIPRELFEKKKEATFLRDVDSKISQAIKKTGYYDSSYYAAPKGLAIVTRMEQIEEDGSPKKEPQRWSLESQSLDEFTLAAYLKALFLSKSGYYRVIVFVVTPYSLMQSSVETTPDEAKKWLSGGHNRLPESIGNMKFSKNYTCTALIYEFERQTESDEPRFRQPGRIPGHTHLVKTGIWQSLEQ